MRLGEVSITDYSMYPLVCKVELRYHALLIVTGGRQVVVVSKQRGAVISLDDLYFPQRRTDDKPLNPNGLGNASLGLWVRSVKQNMCRRATRVMVSV